MTAGEIAELFHVRGISIESAIRKLQKDVISQNRYIAPAGALSGRMSGVEKNA